jgi:hypothetical protein
VSGDPEPAIAAAAALHAPIHTLAVGSAVGHCDVRVGPTVADAPVFVRDVLAVRTRVTASGLTEPTRVTVNLAEPDSRVPLTGTTVDLGPEAPARDVELLARVDQPGERTFHIEAVPVPGEDRIDNNRNTITASVLGEAIRVLYVEGYPRFEYRYLKNIFRRERTIRVSCLLLSADRAFAQEGDEPIRRFPETAEELNAYDIVLFGDVDPAGYWLGEQRARLLVDFVGRRGGGFGLIAGERFAPQAYFGTPLASLIPVRIDTNASAAVASEPFAMQLTAEGRRSRLFRFEADSSQIGATIEALPGMFWFAATGGPKPGAEALATHPAAQTGGEPLPLVVLGRYGAGIVLFQAVDETWRWRRFRGPAGAAVHHFFWVQLVRTLYGSGHSGEDSRLAVRCDRPTSPLGEAVRVGVKVFDAALLGRLEQQLTLVVTGDDTAPVARIRAERLGPRSSSFQASWLPPRAGRFEVRVADVKPPADRRAPSAQIRVEDVSVETQELAADPAALARLARRTGGKTVPLHGIQRLFEAVEDRSVRIPDDVQEPLWRTKLVWLTFMVLIATEWTVRKASGLA